MHISVRAVRQRCGRRPGLAPPGWMHASRTTITAQDPSVPRTSWRNATDALLADLTEDERTAILGGTARAFYGLDI